MSTFNIFLAGVGGQGIGLLSEMVLRAADHAGHKVKGVDTHGLAQRGGIVVSQIRMGDPVYSPLIREHEADLVLALERHEALRAILQFSRPGGQLLYYDTVWQPLGVRLGEASEVSATDLDTQCKASGIRSIRVFEPDLEDVRMQNTVILARVAKEGLIPGISAKHYLLAMEDLMAGDMLEKNKALFEEACGAS